MVAVNIAIARKLETIFRDQATDFTDYRNFVILRLFPRNRASNYDVKLSFVTRRVIVPQLSSLELVSNTLQFTISYRVMLV